MRFVQVTSKGAALADYGDGGPNLYLNLTRKLASEFYRQGKEKTSRHEEL